MNAQNIANHSGLVNAKTERERERERERPKSDRAHCKMLPRFEEAEIVQLKSKLDWLRWEQ